MANSWLRLWHDMPNDPKWRTIARISGEPLALVTAVYIHLLVDASRNVTRGHINVTAEDLASALDVTEQQIDAVLSAMDGRVMDDGCLTGWEKRQPKREDSGDEETGAKSAAQRKKEQREREKLAAKGDAESGHKQPCHDVSRNVTLDKDKDKETSFAAQQSEPVEDDPPPDAPPAAAPIKSLKGSVSPRGTRLPEDWVLPKQWGEWALSETSLTAPAVRLEAAKFGDYWRAKAGREAVKLDWQATWRNWVRTAADRAQGSAKSYPNSAVGTAVFGGAV